MFWRILGGANWSSLRMDSKQQHRSSRLILEVAQFCTLEVQIGMMGRVERRTCYSTCWYEWYFQVVCGNRGVRYSIGNIERVERGICLPKEPESCMIAPLLAIAWLYRLLRCQLRNSIVKIIKRQKYVQGVFPINIVCPLLHPPVCSVHPSFIGILLVLIRDSNVSTNDCNIDYSILVRTPGKLGQSTVESSVTRVV